MPPEQQERFLNNNASVSELCRRSNRRRFASASRRWNRLTPEQQQELRIGSKRVGTA